MGSVLVVKLAGVNIKVSFRYNANFTKFLLFATTDSPQYDISLSHNILVEEKKTLERSLPFRLFTMADAEYNALYQEIQKILYKESVLVFHGVLLQMDDYGYIFTGPSGIGKSTHGQSWVSLFPNRATVINGDKPLLKITKEGVIGHGSPWRGKEGIGINSNIPIKAICRLSRNKYNHIYNHPFDGEVLSWLINSTMSLDRNQQILDLVRWFKNASRFISFYELQCNMELEAARVSFLGMSQ